MKYKFTLTLLFLIKISQTYAFDNVRMDSLFNIIESNDKGMGSLAIFRDGKQIYQKSYGYADVESGKKADANTKYRIGSISKTFTAVIILKLAEEGKLSLSDTLDKYYPQIENSDKITLEHMLRHRSGIFNYLMLDQKSWRKNKHTKQELLDRIVAGDKTFEPDEKMEYSNANYALLAWIAEDVAGQTYSTLLDEIINKPCGLKNTYLGDKTNISNNESHGYNKLSTWNVIPESDLSIVPGAGDIVSTPEDVNIFLYHLFCNKLLSTESIEQMKTLKDHFGMGIYLTIFDEKAAYGHSGSLDGFQTNSYYFPDDNTSIVLFCNGLDYPLSNISWDIVKITYDMEHRLPVFSKPVEITENELDKFLGKYSSPDVPFKIIIGKDNNILTVVVENATEEFPMGTEYIGGNKFERELYYTRLEFLPDQNQLIYTQYGQTSDLTREK